MPITKVRGNEFMSVAMTSAVYGESCGDRGQRDRYAGTRKRCYPLQ
jgi:hypothetical protein